MKLANSYFLLLLSLAVMSPLLGMEEEKKTKGKKEKKSLVPKFFRDKLKKNKEEKEKQPKEEDQSLLQPSREEVEQDLLGFIEYFNAIRSAQTPEHVKSIEERIAGFKEDLRLENDLLTVRKNIKLTKEHYEKLYMSPELMKLKTGILLTRGTQESPLAVIEETLPGKQTNLNLFESISNLTTEVFDAALPDTLSDNHQEIPQPLSPKSRRPTLQFPQQFTVESLQEMLISSADKFETPIPKTESNDLTQIIDQAFDETLLDEAFSEMETNDQLSQPPPASESQHKSPPTHNHTENAPQPNVQPRKSVADLTASFEKKDTGAKNSDKSKEDKKTTPRKTSDPKPLAVTPASTPDSPISLDEQKLLPMPDTASRSKAASSRTTDEKLDTTPIVKAPEKLEDSDAAKSGDLTLTKQISCEQILPPPSSNSESTNVSDKSSNGGPDKPLRLDYEIQSEEEVLLPLPFPREQSKIHDRSENDQPTDDQSRKSVADLTAGFEEKNLGSKTSDQSKRKNKSPNKASEQQPLIPQPAPSRALSSNNNSQPLVITSHGQSTQSEGGIPSDDQGQSVSKLKNKFEKPGTEKKLDPTSFVSFHQLPKSSNPYWMRGLLYLGGTGICTLLGLYGFYKLSPDDPSRPWFVGTSIAGGLLTSLLSIKNFGYRESINGPATNLLNQEK